MTSILKKINTKHTLFIIMWLHPQETHNPCWVSSKSHGMPNFVGIVSERDSIDMSLKMRNTWTESSILKMIICVFEILDQLSYIVRLAN